MNRSWDDFTSSFQISRMVLPWVSASVITLFSVSLASRLMIWTILVISLLCSSSRVSSMCSHFFWYWLRSFNKFPLLFFWLAGESTARGHLDEASNRAAVLPGDTMAARTHSWAKFVAAGLTNCAAEVEKFYLTSYSAPLLELQENLKLILPWLWYNNLHSWHQTSRGMIMESTLRAHQAPWAVWQSSGA